MRERLNERVAGWCNERARGLARLGAGHPFAVDALVAVGVAGVSVIGLSAQEGRIAPITLGFCAGLCVPLLLRQSVGALASFGLMALVALAQWLVSGPQIADVALLAGLYWVALEGGLFEVALASGTLELGAIMAAARWSPSEPVKVWIGLSGLAAAAGGLGVAVRQRRALLASLHEKAARLEFERDQEGRLGAAAERARIAREMHDIVAHNLSVMIALAEGAGYAMPADPGRAAQAIRRVSATGREALLEMRRLLGVLREESSADPLAPQPQLVQLDELLARVQAAGIAVTMDLEGDPRELAEGLQLTVYRVAQEALTNTLKHARRPTSAHVALSCVPGQVELEVTNTGVPGQVEPEMTNTGAPGQVEPEMTNTGAPGEARGVVSGIDPLPGGRGLRGMRERAAAYGGRLEAGPRAEGGWRVHLRLRPGADLAAAVRAGELQR